MQIFLTAKSIYNEFKTYLHLRTPRLYVFLDKYKLIIKYIISGGTAAVVDLSILYGLTEWFKFHYLFSATLAFIIAFFVSFYLQKFWTFRDNGRQGMHKQMTMYFLAGLINLNLNAIGMYVLVDFIHIIYMLAQIIMGVIVAMVSFIVYRYLIFKKKNEPITIG